MEFKINIQTKTITLLKELSVKELKELLERFQITDDWKVVSKYSFINVPHTTWVQPYDNFNNPPTILYSDTCSCNPKNGSLGVCGCTLENGITFTNDVSYGKNSCVKKMKADEL